MIPSSNRICCIAPVGDICGEGAVWHTEEAALYWTDIIRCASRWQLETEKRGVLSWIIGRSPATSRAGLRA
jgi:sugar lactone lactonase YvrE